MGVMKTPGVYIVEKNAFPNSVVEVATAVPAFIGHTDFADNHNRPLHMKPWRITSMGEYHQYFGAGPAPRFTIEENKDASVDPDFKAGSKSYVLTQPAGKDGGQFTLYNNLRLFFQNGGGPCYIVSIGTYKEDLDPDKFAAGIEELLKEQEPTMVIIPEAVLLKEDECIALQQAMLAHCGDKMKNRVAILDIWGGDKPRTAPTGDPVANFRNALGINYLDYASAYYPWLNTSVIGDKDLSFENIANSAVLIALLQQDLGLPATLPAGASPKVSAQFQTIADIPKDWILDALTDAKTGADVATKKAADALTAAANENDETKAAAQKASDAAVAAAKAAADRIDAYTKSKAAKATADAAVAAAANADDRTKAQATADEAAADLAEKSALSPAEKTALETKKALLNKSLIAISGLFGTILGEAKRKLNLMPPSAAMAGIYTMVDNSRGVWKAPANVSLASVISPSVSISAEQQEDLNVTTAGKSINAIRSFIGEGVLVWGARTLDGNSLDWRYVNVRRTMIMLEESCRLAAKALVFEPNVANTWVTIKSMIQNFLTGIWKRGGLAGAVPEDAFSVHVGLGETMTPDDILEGILRVTVLVAMVRPAEFIEITFQQQMQKS